MPEWSLLKHLNNISHVSIKSNNLIHRRKASKIAVQHKAKRLQWSQKQSSLQRKSSRDRISWEMGQTTSGKNSQQKIPTKVSSLVVKRGQYRHRFKRQRTVPLLRRASNQPQESPVVSTERESQRVASPQSRPALQRRRKLLAFLNMMPSQLPKTFLHLQAIRKHQA